MSQVVHIECDIHQIFLSFVFFMEKQTHVCVCVWISREYVYYYTKY